MHQEQLGGFWIIEAADLDAALAWAAKAAAAVCHPIEVRPFEGAEEGCEVDILNEVGTLHRQQGDLGRATAYHREALEMAREIASSSDEAQALAGLGRCALAAGDLSGARDLLGRSRRIFEQIGAAEAADVAAELTALP
jgi:tetratricopeptide (TPR) repeat protein